MRAQLSKKGVSGDDERSTQGLGVMEDQLRWNGRESGEEMYQLVLRMHQTDV